MTTSNSSVSLFDARPFFEKALIFGVQHGIIPPEKLEAICTDAPKGMVQIARYFGTEFLRPELEKAKDRMINLVSLYLESTTHGDLHQAAESLRDFSFMSRSKGGSDMLKSLIAMPQNSHFGMNERGGFTDDQIPLLAKWTLRSLPDYQTELAKRRQVAQVIDAAIWLADDLGMDVSELEEAGKDAEAVIRTALLMYSTKRTEMPDWVAFEKMVAALRKKYGEAKGTPKTKTKTAAIAATDFSLIIPPKLPAHLFVVVEAIGKSVAVDLAKIVDSTLSARKLFDQTPAFIGRYFWVEDALSEVDHFDRSASDVWNKVTAGHSDDSSLLTLFLCVATELAPKTLLTEKAALALIRKVRKSGIKPSLASQYIEEHAPAQYQEDYAHLWQVFLDEAQTTLQSDFDYALKDALTLLRLECNIK